MLHSMTATSRGEQLEECVAFFLPKTKTNSLVFFPRHATVAKRLSKSLACSAIQMVFCCNQIFPVFLLIFFCNHLKLDTLKNKERECSLRRCSSDSFLHTCSKKASHHSFILLPYICLKYLVINSTQRWYIS